VKVLLLGTDGARTAGPRIGLKPFASLAFVAILGFFVGKDFTSPEAAVRLAGVVILVWIGLLLLRFPS